MQIGGRNRSLLVKINSEIVWHDSKTDEPAEKHHAGKRVRLVCLGFLLLSGLLASLL